MILPIRTILRRLFPLMFPSSPAFVRWCFSSPPCFPLKEVVSSLKWSERLPLSFSGNTFLPSYGPIDMSLRCCKLVDSPCTCTMRRNAVFLGLIEYSGYQDAFLHHSRLLLRQLCSPGCCQQTVFAIHDVCRGLELLRSMPLPAIRL